MFFQVMNNSEEINDFFMNNCQNKIEIFVKLKLLKVFMRWKKLKKVQQLRVDGQEDGVPKACRQQRRTREGPETGCVRSPCRNGVAHAGEEVRINVLPWYRLVGVAIPPVSRTRKKNPAAHKG